MSIRSSGPQSLSRSDIAELASPVRAIAVRAGEAILAIRRQGFTVDRKQDNSPVTAADKAAEEIIVEALDRLAPGVPAIAEEQAAAGNCPDIGTGAYWLVDPLDGTREFVAGGDEFAVSIGLIAGGRPVFGVVHAPAVRRIYWNEGPDTAMRAVGNHAPEPVRARPAPPEGLTLVSSRFHSDSRRLAAFLRTVPISATLLASSALKFGNLAEGRADIYPRFGPTSEWDTAGGDAILTAAGGSVRTLDGALLAYGKPHFLNPDFIARGRTDD